MKLPTEIRLLIYKVLLIRDGGPKHSFCLGEHHKYYNRSLSFFVFPTILVTCKAIHHEAMPILYGDNTFEIFCVSEQPATQHLYRTLEFSPLLTCPIPHAAIYFKQVSLSSIGISLTPADIAKFPVYWPKNEKGFLELYPNIESIFLQLRRRSFNTIYLRLARRHQNKRATAATGQDYVVRNRARELRSTTKPRRRRLVSWTEYSTRP